MHMTLYSNISASSLNGIQHFLDPVLHHRLPGLGPLAQQACLLLSLLLDFSDLGSVLLSLSLGLQPGFLSGHLLASMQVHHLLRAALSETNMVQLRLLQPCCNDVHLQLHKQQCQGYGHLDELA